MTEPSLFCLRMVTVIVIHAEEKANHSKILKIQRDRHLAGGECARGGRRGGERAAAARGRGDPRATPSALGAARPGATGDGGSAQRAGGALVRDASRPTMTTALYRVKATERGTQRSSRAGDVESVGRTTP